MAFFTEPPPLVDQHASNGAWIAERGADPFQGRMVWLPADQNDSPDALKTRLLDQPHEGGTWVAGTHCSMTWTPDPTNDQENTP